MIGALPVYEPQSFHRFPVKRRSYLIKTKLFEVALKAEVELLVRRYSSRNIQI